MAELLTASSILVALVTWFVTHRFAARAERIRLTGQLISHLSTNPLLDEANLRISRLLREGDRLEDDDVPDDLDRDLHRVLNYYEFLCDFCALGALDRTTIIRLRGAPIHRTYEATKGYIVARRKRLKYPSLYACLERLAADVRAHAEAPS